MGASFLPILLNEVAQIYNEISIALSLEKYLL